MPYPLYPSTCHSYPSFCFITPIPSSNLSQQCLNYTTAMVPVPGKCWIALGLTLFTTVLCFQPPLSLFPNLSCVHFLTCWQQSFVNKLFDLILLVMQKCKSNLPLSHNIFKVSSITYTIKDLFSRLKPITTTTTLEIFIISLFARLFSSLLADLCPNMFSVAAWLRGKTHH